MPRLRHVATGLRVDSLMYSRALTIGKFRPPKVTTRTAAWFGAANRIGTESSRDHHLRILGASRIGRSEVFAKANRLFDDTMSESAR